MKPKMPPKGLHPGLAALWKNKKERSLTEKRIDSECDPIYGQRWKLFSYIISPKLDPLFLQELPDEDVCFVAILYIMQHEAPEPLLTRRELMAFIVMKARIKNFDFEERLEYVNMLKKREIVLRPRAVHLATIFTHSFVPKVSDLVGDVVGFKNFLNLNNFDGVIFHHVYNKFEDCDDFSKVFENANEKLAVDIFLQAVTSKGNRIKRDWFDD